MFDDDDVEVWLARDVRTHFRGEFDKESEMRQPTLSTALLAMIYSSASIIDFDGPPCRPRRSAGEIHDGHRSLHVRT